MEKRYYWLKFKDDFFDSKRVKKLRKMAGGDTYIVIYLKMQLKALHSDGVLSYTGLEENFADELALDIDESPEDVRMVLAYLMNYGLCECSDNIHYFLPYVVENTGSETATAQRMRDHRSRAKLAERNNVTGLLQECYVEKEKEKDTRDRDKIQDTALARQETGGATIEDPFETFWREYPKKKSKATAKKAFDKAIKKASFDTIMEALYLQRESKDWTKNDRQYCPYPATWLNAEGWLDEVASSDGFDNLRRLYEQTKEEEENDKD